MTAYIGEYRDNYGKKHIEIKFDKPISLKSGASAQERAVIDEFNRRIEQIFKIVKENENQFDKDRK